MPINPAYSVGELPGQPAIQPSPLTDAFQVLSGYVGGQFERKKFDEEKNFDLFKTLISGDVINPSAKEVEKKFPGYEYIPRDQRFKYLQAYMKQQQGQMDQANMAELLQGFSSGGSKKSKQQQWVQSLDPQTRTGLKQLARTNRAALAKRLIDYQDETGATHVSEADAIIDQLMAM